MHRGRPLRDPDREDEWQSGPRLPGAAQVFAERVTNGPRPAAVGLIEQLECGIADDEARLVRFVFKALDIRHLGIAKHKIGTTPPDILEQQFEQRH